MNPKKASTKKSRRATMPHNRQHCHTSDATPTKLHLQVKRRTARKAFAGSLSPRASLQDLQTSAQRPLFLETTARVRSLVGKSTQAAHRHHCSATTTGQ